MEAWLNFFYITSIFSINDLTNWGLNKIAEGENASESVVCYQHWAAMLIQESLYEIQIVLELARLFHRPLAQP